MSELGGTEPLEGVGVGVEFEMTILTPLTFSQGRTRVHRQPGCPMASETETSLTITRAAGPRVPG